MKETRDKTRSKKILAGILTGVSGRALALIAPFLVMPTMLKYLGQSDFGIWMTATSITSMSGFIDFGISNGLLTKLSKAFSDEDEHSAKSYISAAYATLGIIFFFASTLTIIFLLTAQSVWLNTNWEHTQSVEIICITLIAFFLGVPAAIIQKILLARQHNISANLWLICGSLAAIPSCYAAVNLQLSTNAVVAAYSFSLPVILILATIIFFIQNPQLIPSASRLSKQHTNELLGLGSAFFMLSAITSIALNLDNSLISIAATPEEVTSYAVPAKLGSILGLLVTTIYLPFWAASADAFAKGDRTWLKAFSFRISVIGTLVVIAAGAVLTTFADMILQAWMNNLFIHCTQIVGGFTLVFALFSAVSPYNMILNSQGNINVQIRAWIGFAIASILFKYVVLHYYGITWTLPLITAICFGVFVAPAAIRAANTAVRSR